jgi:hypothetical protein
MSDKSATGPFPLAIIVRDACIAAAQAAYEAGGVSGLCAEGRWENALGAMQTLDLEKIVASTRR